MVHLHRDKEEAAFKISWLYLQYYRGCYFVGEALLRERSDKVRAALQELVNALRDERESEYAGLLRAVAEKGRDLYEAFFFGSNGLHRGEAHRVKTWVADKLAAQQDTITFCLPPGVHIPWGLFFDRPVSNDPTQEVDPGGFWCMKYNVGAHYFTCEAYGVEREWRSDQFPLLFAAHETVWTSEYGAKEVVDKEWRRRLDRLLRPPDQPKFLLNELVASWGSRTTDAPYGLFAFYCHSNGQALCIGPDTISAAEFGMKFQRARGGDTPPTLVFLAGCETAIGELEPGFLKETSSPASAASSAPK